MRYWLGISMPQFMKAIKQSHNYSIKYIWFDGLFWIICYMYHFGVEFGIENQKSLVVLVRTITCLVLWHPWFQYSIFSGSRNATGRILKASVSYVSSIYTLSILSYYIFISCFTYPCPEGAMKYRQQWTLLSGISLRFTLDSAFRKSSHLLSM